MRLVASIALGVAALVTGCGSAASTPGGSPDEPVTHVPGDPADPAAPGDGDLLPDAVGEAAFSVDSVSVRVAESFPVQLFLDVTGQAPTPCHQVAYTIDEDPDEISVTITTTSSAESCAQVVKPHQFVIALGPADLPVTVRVNDGEYTETVRP